MSKTVKHKTADTPPLRRMPNRNVRPFFEKLAVTIDEPVTQKMDARHDWAFVSMAGYRQFYV